MTSPAISVTGLSKRYRLGARANAYGTLRDALSMSHRRTPGERAAERELWALRDVTFDIAKGEAVGVLGANGAGKTTLLKVLSRVTEPTAGRAVVHGRIGSLLEVGTGFHPELTGRENVFLNGAILGMRRAEIAAKFDEIVAFAEVERFIDTPVKRYSSGMYVRLAFSVAAHLDVDILLVDEVLSVGDLAFQRKCLGKMQGQTAEEGRTVLFVSHNLASVKLLTETCVWLDHGGLRQIGATEDVFRSYVLAHAAAAEGGVADVSDLSAGRPPGTALAHKVAFDSVALLGPEGTPTESHLEGEPVTVRVRLRCLERLADSTLEVRARLRTLEGAWVFAVVGGRHDAHLEPGGLYETSFTIDPNPLRPGAYQLELYCVTRQAQDLLPSAITLRIEPNVHAGDDPRYAGQLDLGLFRVDFPWLPLAPASP